MDQFKEYIKECKNSACGPMCACGCSDIELIEDDIVKCQQCGAEDRISQFNGPSGNFLMRYDLIHILDNIYNSLGELIK
jgi:hypothetical protein